jgi:transposase
MAKLCQLQITETTEELKALLAQQNTASSREKIQALYLFKIGQVKTVKELAQVMGRNRITLQRWWRTYRREGIAGLLCVRHSGGRQKVIPPEAIKGLLQRLQQPDGFKSYVEIQTWLSQEYGVNASYKVVHDTVRYKLQTQLKVTRSFKQMEEYQLIGRDC